MENTNATKTKNPIRSKWITRYIIAVIMFILHNVSSALFFYYAYGFLSSQVFDKAVQISVFWFLLSCVFYGLIIYLCSRLIAKLKPENRKVVYTLHCFAIFFPLLYGIVLLVLIFNVKNIDYTEPASKAHENRPTNMDIPNINLKSEHGIENKLAKLDSLRNKGLIDDRDYEMIRKDIISNEIGK